MQFELTHKDIEGIEADAAIGVLAAHLEGTSPIPGAWTKHTDGLAREVVRNGELTGKHQSTVVIHRPVGLRVERLALVVCGDRGDWDTALVAEAAGAAWKRLKSNGIRSLAVRTDRCLESQPTLQGIVEGILAADFEPGIYKTDDRSSHGLERVIISLGSQGGSEAPVARYEGTLA